MELKLGLMTNGELAKWFGMSEGSFRVHKKDKLKELEMFANFKEAKGKVEILEIYEPVYNKKQRKTIQRVVDKIDDVWSKDGLDTCKRVGYEICDILCEEGLVRKPDTIVAYTRQGRNELYGKPFVGVGTLGKCMYIWCKRDPETGEYTLLNDEEQEIKQKIQTRYFGDATEKQVLVKGMIESGEISKEEAWGVLEEMTHMKNGNFLAFLRELQDTLHCQVVRGTFVERNTLLGEISKN